MADLHNLDIMIADCISQALGDVRASGELKACLIAGLGNVLALEAAGDTEVASALCDHVGVAVIEAATFAATLFEDAGRL